MDYPFVFLLVNIYLALKLENPLILKEAMEIKTLDMRGQPCPIPVVNAKKALAEQNVKGVKLLVDNIVAVQNLEKMAKGSGCGFSYEGEGLSFKVNIVKGADSSQFFNAPFVPQTTVKNDNPGGDSSPARGPVVLISSDNMGRGAEELGRLLVKGFIFSLTQLDPPPEAIIFLNSGVRLAVEGANTVPDLKELEDKGSAVYVCGTCANYYQLTDSIAVGSIIDMMFITGKLAKASGIITI